MFTTVNNCGKSALELGMSLALSQPVFGASPSLPQSQGEHILGRNARQKLLGHDWEGVECIELSIKTMDRARGAPMPPETFNEMIRTMKFTSGSTHKVLSFLRR